MTRNGDTIRTKWVMFLIAGFIVALVLVATLQPAGVISRPNIILPTPTQTVFLRPTAAPTVTITPAAQTQTIIIPGQSRQTTIIVISPSPFPSPYPSPCDPTPAVGNCPPGRRMPAPPATPAPGDQP